MGSQIGPTPYDVVAMFQHHSRRDTGEPLYLIDKPFAVMHGARMACFVYENTQGFGAEGFLPEAIHIDRQRQNIVLGPIRQECSKLRSEQLRFATKCKIASHRVQHVAGGIDELLAKPHSERQASVNMGQAALLANPFVAWVFLLNDMRQFEDAFRDALRGSYFGLENGFLAISRKPLDICAVLTMAAPMRAAS